MKNPSEKPLISSRRPDFYPPPNKYPDTGAESANPDNEKDKPSWKRKLMRYGASALVGVIIAGGIGRGSVAFIDFYRTVQTSSEPVATGPAVPGRTHEQVRPAAEGDFHELSEEELGEINTGSKERALKEINEGKHAQNDPAGATDDTEVSVITGYGMRDGKSVTVTNVKTQGNEVYKRTTTFTNPNYGPSDNTEPEIVLQDPTTELESARITTTNPDSEKMEAIRVEDGKVSVTITTKRTGETEQIRGADAETAKEHARNLAK